MTALHQFQQPESDEALALGTDPVPAGPYYQDEYFELEKEAIFKRSWLNIGHVCELLRGWQLHHAATRVRQRIDPDHPRQGQGHPRLPQRLLAPRHAADPRAVRQTRQLHHCPYHGWTFNNTGELRAAPDFDRFYVEQKDCGLPKVSVDVCAGLIFVNLDAAPKQSLREFLGPFPAQWETLPVAQATTFCEYVYEIDGNWKLTYDNFQENYHLRFIHPRTGGGGAVGQENPFGYPASIGFHGEHRIQTIWTNPSPIMTTGQKFGFGKLMSALMQKGLMSHPHGRAYWAVFPNLFMLGTPTQPFVHYVIPISARKSRGVVRIYWVGDDANASERYGREFSMATARDVHCEDRAIIEAGQRGLSSGALKHITSRRRRYYCGI